MSNSQKNFEDSIFFRIFFLLGVSFRNSSFYKLLNGEIKLNFFDSFFLVKLISFCEKLCSKLFFLKKYFDKIINFCLSKSSKKIIIILLFFIITNEFFRNNVLAEIFYVPVLIMLFLILTINFIILFEDKKKFLLYIFLFFFFIKIFYFFGAYNFIEFDDERAGYSEFSWRLLKFWFYKGPVYYNVLGIPIFEGKPLTLGLYYSFIALLYYFFGKHFLIAKLFSLFIHLASGILLYFLAKELFNQKTAIISIILFYTLFSINLFSIALLREAPMIFLILLFFLLLTKLNKFLFQNNTKTILITILMFFVYYAANNIRTYVGGLLIPSFFVWTLFYLIKKFKTNIFFKNFILFLLIVLVFSVSLTNSLSKISVLENKINSLLEKTNLYRNTPTDRGRLEFFIDANVSTIKNALLFLPIGLTYVFFSILPSEVKYFDLWIFFLLDTAVWYFLLFFIFLGFIYALKDNITTTSPVITFIILAVVGHALVEGNFGNLLRHAGQFKSLMLMFGAYGIDKLFNKPLFYNSP